MKAWGHAALFHFGRRRDRRAYPLEFVANMCFTVSAALWMMGTMASAADWRAGQAAGSGKSRCILTSAKKPVHDGYQQVSAQIIVDGGAVIVKSDSVLDPGFSDIEMQVDEREFIPMDKVKDRKQAVFEANYSKIIQQFKEGREVTVRMRFWPTWPATGLHSVSFSLIGFTKVYSEARTCNRLESAIGEIK